MLGRCNDAPPSAWPGSPPAGASSACSSAGWTCRRWPSCSAAARLPPSRSACSSASATSAGRAVAARRHRSARRRRRRPGVALVGAGASSASALAVHWLLPGRRPAARAARHGAADHLPGPGDRHLPGARTCSASGCRGAPTSAVGARAGRHRRAGAARRRARCRGGARPRRGSHLRVATRCAPSWSSATSAASASPSLQLGVAAVVLAPVRGDHVLGLPDGRLVVARGARRLLHRDLGLALPRAPRPAPGGHRSACSPTSSRCRRCSCGWVFLGEVPTVTTVVGGAMVVLAGIMVVPRATVPVVAPDGTVPSGTPR